MNPPASITVAALLFSCIFSTRAPADDYVFPCQEALETAKNWDDLFEWYRLYPECNDGSLAEMASDMVTQWLALDGKEIGRLAELVGKSVQFRDFILGHIDEVSGSARMEKIIENAAERCPDNATDLCCALIEQANRTLAAIRAFEEKLESTGR